MEDLSKFKVILLDIEGTITRISFVKEKLFGYVRKNLKSYLNNNSENKIVQNAINGLFAQAIEAGDFSQKPEPNEITNKAEEIVLKWMDSDKKYSSLKTLQGLMFEDAYTSGLLIAELFPDVLPSIRKLKELDKRVSIYSSGSIFAQKLLFGHTAEGDIKDLLNSYYDTSSGAKIDASSYTKIAQEEGVECTEVLFLTDLLKEAEAARDAGCAVAIMLREGNADIDAETLKGFQCFESLHELFV